MKHLARRDVLRSTVLLGAASIGAVAPLVAVAMPQPQTGGELAGLIRAYWQHVKTFDDWDIDDDLAEGFYDNTLQPSLHRLLGVPVRTNEDAAHAIEWLLRELDVSPREDGCTYDRIAYSMLASARDFLGGVQS